MLYSRWIRRKKGHKEPLLLFPHIPKDWQKWRGIKIIAEWSRRAKEDKEYHPYYFLTYLKIGRGGGGVKIIAEWSRRAGRTGMDARESRSHAGSVSAAARTARRRNEGTRESGQ